MIFPEGYSAGIAAVRIAASVLLTVIILSLGCHRKSAPPPTGSICIIIDDFGYSSNTLISELHKLEPNITLAILPGRPYTRENGRLADSLGMEVIVHMPMEPVNPADTLDAADEPYLLSENLNEHEVADRVRTALAEVPMAVGMNNHMGSAATEDLQLMKTLARILRQEELYFIDSFTSPESRAFLTMHRYGVSTEVRTLFLDTVIERRTIQSQLDSLAVLSRERGIVIGIGHATHPETIEVLTQELPKLKARGYRFLKASAVVR